MMINSQLNHFSSSFGDEDMNFREYKIDTINYSPTERKPSRNNNKSNSTPGSNSSSSVNSNSTNNGVYVDAGKVLLEAAKTGDTEKVHDCIKNGAPFITDWLGTSALHIAAKNNFYETCATLLRAGISKDAKTKVDRTPLHFAVFEGNFEICQLLLQHECSVDPLDMLRMSPLHWAVDRSFDNIAELLLEYGSNPHLVSKFLKTPYSIAKEKNNDFIVNIMENLPGIGVSGGGEKPKLKCQKSSLSDHVRNLQSENSSRKRDKSHNFDSSTTDTKRMKTLLSEDTNSLTLEMLKDQMTSMMSNSDDNNMIESVLQSGRKITLTEAGKRLLNDSSLNKILKNPLSVSKKSTPATITSESSNNVLEIFRENSKSAKSDILNILRSASTSDFQEVTITQCSKLSPTPSPTQKSSGINSLSAINVPKLRKTLNNQTTTTSTIEEPESMQRKIIELTTNYQQLRRQFEREQQKTSTLQRQLKQLEMNYENFKRQQAEKFEIFFSMLSGVNMKNNKDDSEEVEEVL